jgi:hypothetical protein
VNVEMGVVVAEAEVEVVKDPDAWAAAMADQNDEEEGAE